jgi:hypothetical protein
MVLENSKFALLVLALVYYASPVTSQNTPNENLVLADCGIGLGPNGGSTSFEAIYYNGDIWTGQGENTYRPTMMVNVPWTGQYPWSWVGFTMPNGDEFSVMLDGGVKDPGEAGFATHTYEPKLFMPCYSYHRDRVFQLADGKWCSSAYVCNYRGQPYPGSGPTKPEPEKPEPQKMEIHGSMTQDTVEFWEKPATQIMNTARQAFLSDGYSCDTTKRPINDKCTISWSCTGDPANNSLERMAQVFDKLATHDKFTSMREVVTDVCRYPDTRPGKEGQCRQYEQKIDRYYKVPGSIKLTMRNVPRDGSGENSNVHGELEYTIQCDTSRWECMLCNAVGTALSVPVPAAGALVSIGCQACKD